VRTDGTVGVLHYDLRSDTPDPATLLADAWLLTSADGSTWRETRVTGPFDMTQAPDASGALFLGDYFGLVGAAGSFTPLYVTSSGNTQNRTDVFVKRIDDASARREAPMHTARASPVDRTTDAGYEARRHANLVEAMERRIPGWGRRLRSSEPR
jgi:hypothetical protein